LRGRGVVKKVGCKIKRRKKDSFWRKREREKNVEKGSNRDIEEG
jgi:hypothetical protein